MLVVLLAGPTTFIFDVFVTSIGDYLSSLVELSFRIFAYDDDAARAGPTAGRSPT